MASIGLTFVVWLHKLLPKFSARSPLLVIVRYIRSVTGYFVYQEYQHFRGFKRLQIYLL